MKVHAGMEVRCCGKLARVESVRDVEASTVVEITYQGGTWAGITVTVREDVLEPIEDLSRRLRMIYPEARA